MKFKSQVLTQASGSIGGITYSRNRGGMYQRARAVPVNPSTSRQQIARAAMSTLVFAWVNELTPAERASWDLYAFNVPLIDKLGEPINVGGVGMFVRSNVPRIVAGLTRVNDGPTDFSQGDVPVLTSQLVEDDGGITIGFIAEIGTNVIVQEGRPQNASVNYYEGPWSLVGNSATTPFGGTSRYDLAVGQAMFFRLRRTHPDGRLSPPITIKVLVTPSS